MKVLALMLRLILLLCPAAVTATPGATITQALSHPTRPDIDIKKDSSRNPQAILRFFAIKPGMTVLDVYATSGYYTELLSHIVGSQGKVLSHNSKAYRKFVGQSVNNRYLNNRLANVEKYFSHPGAVEFAANSLDMALMITIYHDLYITTGAHSITGSDRKHFIKQIYQALKPGGILGIIDHASSRGSDVGSASRWHRLSASIVHQELSEFGFELIDENKALRNGSDPHEISIFDKSVRGKTDRYILKFRKPSGL